MRTKTISARFSILPTKAQKRMSLELASVLVPTKIPSFLAVDNVGKRLCKLCKLYRLPKSRKLPTMYRYWINKRSFVDVLRNNL